MITGGCMCGACRYKAKGKMLWTAYCHCRDCQRASGADYVSWFGMERSGVTWSGPRQEFESSPGVTRSFCSTCGTPLSFESHVFPTETHFYAPSLDDLSLYLPKGHVFWSEHVPWLSNGDDLPKHPKGLQAAAVEGKDLGIGKD
ncbi:MAG: GFA family protein [Silicimonas sp.]|nr:GFA family protein [Silicimonas sp.]